METIIAEIAEKFIKNIANILTEGEKSFAKTEKQVFSEVKRCAARLMSAHAAALDAAILSDKGGRRETGHQVERRGDGRKLQTLLGEVCFERTYYKKASGGYEYLVDSVMGIDRRERVSEGLSLLLANAARDMSYGKSSTHITGGEVSRQTVMSRVRRSEAVVDMPQKRQVPELHIDADEAHITLCGGRKSDVPLISVYEGIEKHGKRNSCKNVFHISEYGKTPDELWEQVLTEIEARYDLTDTKIYLHGDGAGWIQKGFEWIPNAVFVLDKYHKNKAIKGMTAGLTQEDRKLFDHELRVALANGDIRLFDEMALSLCAGQPERAEKIQENAGYLKRFVNGISICKTDPRANNGGCTEPHVSHVLSARLSSRPMAWSKRTLKQLAPVLAAGNVSFRAKEQPLEFPKPLRKAAASASKAFLRGTAGLPSPDVIGTLPLSGKITGTQKILKRFS